MCNLCLVLDNFTQTLGLACGKVMWTKSISKTWRLRSAMVVATAERPQRLKQAAQWTQVEVQVHGRSRRTLTLCTRPLVVLSNAGGSGVLRVQHTAGYSNYQLGHASPTNRLALRACTARISTRLEWSASACDPFSLAERTWMWLDPSRRKWQTKYSLIWLPRHWRENFPTVTRTNQSLSNGRLFANCHAASPMV